MAAADSRDAHAAHRRSIGAPGRDVSLADVDGACVDAAGDLDALLIRTGEHRGVEAVVGVVRLLDGLVHGIDRVQGHEWAEGFAREALRLLGNVREQRRLEEQRAEVRARLAADEHSRALGDGIVDMLLDRGELVRGDERTHLLVELVARADLHLPDAADEGLFQLVGDRPFDVHALDGDAQLAGVREHGAGGDLGDLVDIGVRRHNHGVLAAELRGEVDEPLPRLRGEFTTGGRGAGEHEVVAVVDDRGADLAARPRDHGEQVAGHAGAVEQLGGGQRAERRLGVRLEHDRVAGDHRRDRVGHREGERVVPRRDHADDALGQVVDLGLGEHRDHALGGFTAELLRGELGVVRGGHRHVENLFERRRARLAGFGLDHVEEELAVLVHEHAELAEDAGALGHGPRRPFALGRAGALGGGVDVGGRADHHLRERFAGEHLVDRAGLPARRVANEFRRGHQAAEAGKCFSARCRHMPSICQGPSQAAGPNGADSGHRNRRKA